MSKVKLRLTEDGRISLDAPYFPEKSGRCKSISGARFSDDKLWYFPLSLEAAYDLKKVFADHDLEVDPALVSWTREAWLRGRSVRSMGRATDGPLEAVRKRFPAMYGAMDARPYQRAGAAFLSTARVAGNFDDPGLGKTIQSLASIIEAGLWEGQHLIVCPSKTALNSTWEFEVAKWTDAKTFICNQDSAAERHRTIQEFIAYDGPKFLGINHVMLQVRLGRYCRKCKEWSKMKDASDLPIEHFSGVGHVLSTAINKAEYMELFDIEWDSIIADECHNYMLTCRSQPHLCKTQWATGLMMLQSKPGGIRQAMSGTPIRGREDNFFGILSWLNPKVYSSYWKWAEKYLDVQPGYGTSKIVGGLRHDMESAFFQDIDTIFLRRTKYEARPELKDVAVIPIDKWVKMDKAQAKQYNDFKDGGSATVGDRAIDSLGVLSELVRSKQFAFGSWKHNGKSISPVTSPKLDLVLDMLDERGITSKNWESNPDAFDKIIIVSQFTEVIDFFKEKLDSMGIGAAVLTGKEKKYKGRSSAEVFKEPGGPRILLMNVFTGGTSLTLDGYCDEMIILDETWVHDDIVQTMGRIDNRGARIVPRFFYFIRTKGTVEEHIYDINMEQALRGYKMLDERRIIELGRSLI